MRKGKYLIGALVAAVAVVGVSSVASGARTVNQLTTADVCPVLNPSAKTCSKTLRTKRRKYKSANLHTVLAARDSADPEACRVTPDTSLANPRGCRVPPASSLVHVDFDNDIRFNMNAVGKCNPATVAGDPTNTARSQCSAGWIGSGSGFGRFGSVGTPGGGDVPVNISAFNSTNANQIIFHVDPGFAPFDLTGTLVNSPQPGDYGKRLSTPVVAANVLVRFDINIAKGGFIRARCRDRNRKFNFHYRFNYGDSGVAPNDYPSSTDTFYTDGCKRIKPRRKRR
jgi:hypothetical protein